MNYIVLDLEWNQSPSGKRFQNKNLPFEIIEIGAIKLNSKFKEIDRFSELIKPRVYKNINHIIGNITHLDMEELNKARSFKEVMKDFLEFCGDDYIFCTWGNLDLLELQRNMKYFGLKPLSKAPICFMDVQKIFALQTEGKKNQHTLEYAVDYYKIEKDVPFHRAVTDAYYTAKIMPKMKRKNRKLLSFDTYQVPKCKEDEVRITFDDYFKFISQGYNNKQDAFLDPEVTFSGCYLCKRKTTEIIPWFSNNSKHYYGVSKCKRHGLIKRKIRIRKSEFGKTYVIKTMKKIHKSELEEISKKYDKYLNPAADAE